MENTYRNSGLKMVIFQSYMKLPEETGFRNSVVPRLQNRCALVWNTQISHGCRTRTPYSMKVKPNVCSTSFLFLAEVLDDQIGKSDLYARGQHATQWHLPFSSVNLCEVLISDNQHICKLARSILVVSLHRLCFLYEKKLVGFLQLNTLGLSTSVSPEV